MAFDWFRRKFQQESTTSASEQEPQEHSTVEQEEPAAAQPEAEPATAAADWLAYAKAAYANIQRQKEQAAEAAMTDDAVTEAEVTTVGTDESIPDADTDAIALTSTVISTDVVAELDSSIPPNLSTGAVPSNIAITDAPEMLEVEVSPVAEPETSAVTPSPEAEPALEQAAPLPFWARAEAERQERLERLRETAIVEPEPVVLASSPQPTAPVSSKPSQPIAAEGTSEDAMTLDEGFLWSTEILAAQGRRADEISVEEITWLQKLRQGLTKTRLGLVNQLKAIVGQGPLNQDAVSEIEALLLQADVGVAATDLIIGKLQTKMRSETLPPEQAIAFLKTILREMLDRSHHPTFAPQKGTLNIWLMTGVNGVGKTTTIGKIAHIAQKSGYKCMIAAADTFRAAAVEQVKVWGQRSGVDVISNPGQNTDPAAVVFDAIAAAQAREIELLLVDTAGRLQNKKNLMDELSKVRRIIDKKAPGTQVESLLVLDSTLGQNGLRQAEVFSEAAQLSGVVLTKLDGTAKGGVALAVVEQLGLPIRFIGAGEGIEDLRPFSSYEFIEALLSG
jgi:fused signal recognition particle receptor